MGDANFPPELQARARANFNIALDYIDKVQVSSSKAAIPTTYSQALTRISGNTLLLLEAFQA
jgi:hypothetical protein